MTLIKSKLKYILLLMCSLLPGFFSFGQSAPDSLTLSNIIGMVLQKHPSIKAATESINYADASVGLAKSGYYPNIDATAAYNRIGPVSELSFPGMGTFHLYPADNYVASLNYFQTIYDFGKTSKNVAFATENKILNQQNLEQVKQKLAYQVTMIYYSVVYLQQAIEINKQQQKTLNEHLNYVEKKLETGSATQYEILSTKVKISAIENTGIDYQSALNNQLTELNVLMGNKDNKRFTVKDELNVKLLLLPYDSMVSYAYEHRDELKIAREKTAVSELKYKMIKAQNNPSLNLQATAGGKNGYVPDLNEIKANYVVGLGLKIPVFDGTKTKYNLSQAKSTISISEMETDMVKDQIRSKVEENIENMKASLKKIDHFKLQLSQSEEAYKLAQVNYKAGVITNLELLDAATSISESKLLLLRSNVDYITNAYKLKFEIGERLY